MLNIYLCEDNETQRNLIKDFIEKIILIEDYDLSFQCSTNNPHDVLDIVKKEPQVGLYFLDIDLNCDMTGLVLAQEIRKYDPRGFIVFITTHSEMSYMTFSYKVEAMDFILKDNPKELQNRIHQCINNAYTKYSSNYNQYNRNFTIKTMDKELCFPYDDIVYFETSQTPHKLILHGVHTLVEFQAKLKDIEPSLDSRFARCHRSYLINKNHIKEINLKERTITMNNGDTCFASAKLIKSLTN